MATDITKVNNVVEVTVGTNQPIGYNASGVKYSFNAAGTILNVAFNQRDNYSINFDDLTVGGDAPADVAAAYTALSSVFPNEGGGSGSTPTLDQVLAEGGSITGNKAITLAPNSQLKFEDDLTPWFLLDNTEGLQAVKLICPNNDNTGYSEIIMNANGDDGYKFKLESTNGTQDVYIIGKGDINNSLEYVAGTHAFTGDAILSGLAGGGVTGASIDDTGKLIRTP